MIVPALMAMQADVGRQIAAARRALSRPRRNRVVGAANLVGVVGITGLFTATLGAQIMSGGLVIGLSGTGVAATIFVGGSGAILLCVYAISAIIMKRNMA